MPTNDIQLTAGIRNNLLLLQFTSERIDRTQQRLATGNKINSAIDGAVAFFASKGLNRRADDLAQLKDSIGQSISTIKAADTGVTSIEKMLDQAKGLITSAYGSLGKDSASVALRKSLSDQFNNLLRQIDKQAGDATKGRTCCWAAASARCDLLESAITPSPASATRVTSVVSADDYVVDITSDGAISGDASDIANAERDRGIQNLTIADLPARRSATSTISSSVPAAGGQDLHRQEGGVSVTKTFTTEQWKTPRPPAGCSTDQQLASGTHQLLYRFRRDRRRAGYSRCRTSVIEKNVNIAVATTNLNGVGQRIERSALSQSGQQKLSDGENLGLRFRHAPHDGG
jgi:hypothetical protein